MTPTPEQLAIIEAAQSSTDNLIITALAGSAKTTTLRLIAEALRNTPTLCLAFNKKAATDLQERLPPNTKAMTLNGLGHRAWMSRGTRLTLDDKKLYRLFNERVKALSKKEQEPLWEAMPDLLQCLRWMKVCGAVPDGTKSARPLQSIDLFFDDYEEIIEPEAQSFLVDILAASIEEAQRGIIDFDDQIYMPTIFPAAFDPFPLVLVDEAQDLSPINHAMLGKIVKKRIIAVGDPNQSIYAFRGADISSMSKLKSTFDMRELTLSTSFRCPRRVVNEARWRAPKMQYPEWAAEGEVRTMPAWRASDVPDGAAILCRNNAPLFRCAINLMREHRRPELFGADVGKRLIKTMQKLGPKQLPPAESILLLEEWRDVELKKTRSEAKVHDTFECIKVFIDQTETLGDAIAFLESILAQPGSIRLMTIHRSKGGEWDDVFILDRKIIRLDEDQDRNLLYVGQTRAKRTLTYITNDGFIEGEKDA